MSDLRNRACMPSASIVWPSASRCSARAATVDAPATAATRYTLTAEGQKSFIARKTATGDAAAPDFCAAHLTLDRIVGWAPEGGNKAGFQPDLPPSAI